MATDADIQWWLSQHPGASDQMMRGAMDRSGVGVGQVAQVTGVDPSQVAQRYGAAGPGHMPRQRYNAQDIHNWLAQNPNATDEERRAAMDQYGVSPFEVSQATGMGVQDVSQRYQAAGAQGTPNTQAMGAPITGNTQLGGGTSLPPIGGIGQSVPGQRPAFAAGGGQGAYGVPNRAPGAFGSNAMMQKLYPTQGQSMPGQRPANALTSKMYPGVPGIKNYLS